MRDSFFEEIFFEDVCVCVFAFEIHKKVLILAREILQEIFSCDFSAEFKLFSNKFRAPTVFEKLGR